MIEQEAKKLAEEHWKWVETWLHLIYVDAFIHGVKHGQQDEFPNALRHEAIKGAIIKKEKK